MPVSRAATRQRLLAGASVVALALHAVPAVASCLYSGNDQTISAADTGSCVSWSSGNLSVTNTGTISGGNPGVSISGSNISGTLTNSGRISGSSSGIVNSGTIGTLTNSGSISGAGNYGIDNTIGSITALTNSGSISGRYEGIVNVFGTIGTLTNSGSIGGSISGIYNSGSIGTLTNQSGGTVSGNSYAISNSGKIGTLTNNGVLTATYVGIYNATGDTITTLTNSGSISGRTGIYDRAATITTLINNGTITGTTGVGLFIGAFRTTAGSIGTLVNTGTIEGPNAISITSGSATLGAIDNSGLIAGSITSASARALTIDGGSGSTYGTLTGFSIGSIGTITNTASNVVFGSGNLLLNDAINAGTNTVTNSGATLSITNTIGVTGTYAQSAGALQFGSGGELSITGAASITGGTIGVGSSTGNYLAGTSQTLISASASSSYSGATLDIPTGLAATGAASGNNYVATFNNDYVGGSLAGITNTGVLSGAATMVYVAATGSLGSLTTSGTIGGSVIGINNLGSIGSVTNTGTISAPVAIDNASTGTLGPIANSGLIAGSITNSATQALTIDGGSGSTIGTLTGSSGGIGSADEGFITNTASNVVFGSGNLLLNDAVNAGSHAVTNSGATLSITNTIGVTGTYAQSAGALQFGSGGELSITGAASITGGTIGFGSSTGNYLVGASQTLVSASASSTYSGATLGTPTGLAATGAASGNNYVATVNNDYVGGSLAGISNTGVLSGAATMVYVAATGSLGSLTNSGTISGSAVGINNLGSIGSVTNTGTISAPIAIDSSGTLGPITNSGLIAGNITNTAAQDLTINGGVDPTYGTLTGASGGIGVADEGTITNTASNVVFGSGDVLLNDAINVGSHTVTNSGATIEVVNPVSITGAYLQTAGGLVAQVASSSSYGYLAVSGNATVANASIVIQGSGLASGNTFTIVQSGATGSYTGDTASVIGTSLPATVQTVGNDLVVSLGTTSDASNSSTFTAKGAAAGGVAAPLGATLDVINGNSSSTAIAFQNQVLVPLALLPSGQQGETIKQLAPVQNTFQVIDVGAMTVLNAVDQHQQLAMAYNPATGEAAGSDTLDSTLWAQMLGGGSQRDSNAAAAGYRSSDFGLTAGADHLFTPDLLGGVALSWLRAWTRGTGTSSGQSSTLDSYQLTFYGTYRMGRAFLDGQLGAGWNHFDQNRSIDFLNETASAGYDGQQYLASALAGYDIGVGGPGDMTVTPLAGLRWLRAHTDSYTESGAGAADLSVNGQTTDAVTQELGFRTSWTFHTGLGTIQPELKAEWLHDYTHGAIATSGVIGGTAFTTTTPRTSADGARIGIAATLATSDSLSFRAEYDGELRSGYQSHTGLIKALWQF